MAQELRPLVRDWKLEGSSSGVTVYSSETVVAAFAGMGAQRATLATAGALALGPVHLLISAGLAGGLHAEVLGGTVHHPEKVVDAATGEAYESERPRDHGAARPYATLLTVGRVLSRDGKRRLREQYSGDLVDMEAATVARLARARNIPFLAVKAVSDEYDFELPGMDSFVSPEGRFRKGAYGLYIALRPHLWRAAARMGRTSAAAADALCMELVRVIAGDGNRAKRPADATK
jgi:adenosylhomocysteine nucleosidase